MKYLPVFVIALLVVSCATTGETVKKPAEKNVPAAVTGWNDNDTYTVRVTGKNESEATNNAKHRILKDIVNARMRNSSPFTDIKNIREEFKKPFDEGQILSRKVTGNEVEIFYQIREKGLKSKFMRK